VVSAGGEMARLVRPLQPLRVAVDDRGWRFAGRTAGGISVEVEAHANGTLPHLLPVPEPAERRHRENAAAQHLAGELRVSLRRRGRPIYEGTSRLAGLERGNGRD
jgi:tocopherol cyclase